MNWRDLDRLIEQIKVAHPEYDTFQAYVYLSMRLYDHLPPRSRSRVRGEIYDTAVRSGNPIIK